MHGRASKQVQQQRWVGCCCHVCMHAACGAAEVAQAPDHALPRTFEGNCYDRCAQRDVLQQKVHLCWITLSAAGCLDVCGGGGWACGGRYWGGGRGVRADCYFARFGDRGRGDERSTSQGPTGLTLQSHTLQILHWAVSLSRMSPGRLINCIQYAAYYH